MKNPSIVRMAVVYNFHPCRQSHLVEARATAMDQGHHPCQKEPVLMGPQSHLMEARVTAMGQVHHPYHQPHLMEVGHLMNWTALLTVSWRRYLPVVRALLDAGAENDRANRNRGTPPFIASQKGHLPVVVRCWMRG